MLSVHCINTGTIHTVGHEIMLAIHAQYIHLVFAVDVHLLLYGKQRNQITKNGCRRAQCYILVITDFMQHLAEHSTPIQSLGCMFDEESASTVAPIFSASSPQYIT